MRRLYTTGWDLTPTNQVTDDMASGRYVMADFPS